VYEVIKAGIKDDQDAERRQERSDIEDDQGAEQRERSDIEDERGRLSWVDKDRNAANLCVFLIQHLTGNGGMADYVGEFFERYPIQDLRQE